MMFQQTRTCRIGLGSRIAQTLVFAAAFFAFSATAQTPTQQQLDIYKNLPADQQKAILDTMGRGGNGGGAADRPIAFPETVRPRNVTDTPAAQTDPRLKAGDTLLLYLDVRKFEGPEPKPTAIPGPNGTLVPAPTEPRTPIEYSKERTDDLKVMRERIERRNPYRLDPYGSLNLPEAGLIVLAGLTVEQAQERIAADPVLRDFKVKLMHLPVEAQGAAALKPFGYDLFAGNPSTFAPATDIPVPAEYVVGPGDSVQVQLIGNTKGNYTFTVDREGKINFPELGPVAVGGMRFEALRAAIERRVREQMIGTQVSVTMGELRSIRIFVLGDAEQPGSYTVSGLSTITNALFVSGGVKPIGSLRKIELKRNGTVITRFDLYDLLLRGDTRADARLLPGDVIFIPPVGATVGLSGAVRRPAIYELSGEATTQEVISLAGGLTAEADASLATVERIDDQRQRVTLSVNLTGVEGQSLKLRASDTLRVPSIRPSLEQSVTLSGYVYRPGDFQYRAGMRLSDLLPNVNELKPNADLRYVLIRRELEPNRRIAVFSTDLARALTARGTPADTALAPRDRVYVFDLESGRDSVVEPLMRELRMQSSIDAPTTQVRVGGKVKVPGEYPLEPGMRVSDLVRAGGSLDQSAYEGRAELTRYAVIDGESRKTELIEIDIKRIRAGDASADLELKPFDTLLIKETPMWAQQEIVELRGEVRFPGRYPIYRGETLRSVLARAGGLTDLAFVEGAVFTREELRERERKQIETLANRMQSDLGQLSLQTSQEVGKDASQALAAGQALLANLRATQPVGRLVIDLPRSASAKEGSSDDIVLKNADLLVVPRAMQEVTVLGEVQTTTSHLYNEDLGRDDYIAKSGGFTPRADEDRVYVVKADGSVVANNNGSWFSRSNGNIHPGDTVVVPMDAERMRALPMWTAITTIIYNLAIAVAAVNSF
jgi:protein involved in polysaccharide export with SLBB domain